MTVAFTPEVWGAIAALHEAACRSSEEGTLDALLVNAGLTWEHVGCWTNGGDEAVCGHCSTPYRSIPAEDVLGSPQAERQSA